MAKVYLAIFAFAIGFGAASVARAGSDFHSTFLVSGSWNYYVSGDKVVLTLDRVDNITDPRWISGELWLELWAFPVPYSGLGQANYQQQGYKLASYALERVETGYYLYAINSGPIPYNAPPPGTYYITSLLIENDPSIMFGSRWPRAYFNYSPPQSPITIAPPFPGATPKAGLWWDPNQIGTGYTININHGVAVVAVYSYQVDGAPVWYLASGPMANNGQTFSAPLTKYFGGPCIGCTDNDHLPTPNGNDGNITIVFNSSYSATVFLPEGRVAHIVPADF
jgi:hypothetical protein